MATTTAGTCVSIFCTECGKPNSGTSKFCFSCGNTLARGLAPPVAIGASQTVTTAPLVVGAPAAMAPEFQRFDKIFRVAFWSICFLVDVALLATALGPNITFPQASFSAIVVVGCFYLYLGRLI